MTERKRLGEMLVEAGMIDNMQLQSALGHQKQWGGKLGDILLEMDFISEHVLADFFESHLNIPCLDLSDFEIPANVRGLLKDEIIKKYSVVPIGYENKVLTVAMSDPSDIKTIDELQFATGYRIKPILVFSLDIKRLIQRYFGEEVSPGHQYKSKVHEIAEEKDFELVRDEKQKIQKKEVTVKDYLDAMTSLLIEKGVITREELQKKYESLLNKAEKERHMSKKVFPPAIIFNPTPVIMVSCQGADGRPNIITVSWAGVICSEPPMISISIRPNRHSNKLVKESMEFALNFPSASLIEKADYCGSVSGKSVDKFQETNLTPVPAKEIKAPIIQECPINVECKVRQIIPLGSHDLFIAEVVAYHLDEDIIVKTNKADIEKADPVAYLPGTLEYRRLGAVSGTYGFTKGKIKEVGA